MIEALQCTLGFLEVVFRVVDRAAVLTGHQQIAHYFWMVLVQHFTNSKEVAQRLGHLFAIDTHRTGVHPGHCVGLLVGCFALRYFVLMVRKHQIRTATMNIKGVTQAAIGHDRALDMPARTTFTPGRRPTWFAGLHTLPEDKVQRILLGFVYFYPCADPQVSNFFP